MPGLSGRHTRARLHRAQKARRLKFTATVTLGLLAPLLPAVTPGGSQPAAAQNSAECSVSAAAQRASIQPSGEQFDDNAYDPNLAADSGSVSWSSYATNAVPEDSNDTLDVFATDLDSGGIQRLSVATNGEAGNGSSSASSLNADGSLAAFGSNASNLVGGDTDTSARFSAPGFAYMPYGMFTQSATLTVEFWFKTAYDGFTGPLLGYSNVAQGNQPSQWVDAIYIDTSGRIRAQFWNGAVSPINSTRVVNDGRWHHVVLTSTAAGTRQRLYVDHYYQGYRDGQIDHLNMQFVTIGSAYTSAYPNTGSTGWRHFSGWIDELSVTWGSLNLTQIRTHYAARTGGYRDAVMADGPDAYWRMNDPSSTNLMTDSTGSSHNGAYFSSGVRRQEPGALTWDTNDSTDVFVRDLAAGTTEMVSTSVGGAPGNGDSHFATISDSGDHVLFQSEASSLVVGDTNNAHDLFVHDRQTGETERVSTTSSGGQATDWSYQGSLTPDGRFVAMYTSAQLDPADTNSTSDIYVKDRQSGETTLVSRSTTGGGGNDWSYSPSISDDGRYVAFYSWSSNLVPGDTNGVGDVFVADTHTGELTRISNTSTGVQSPNASFYPSISGDGRYISFSTSSALVPGDSNGDSDVYLYERPTGRIHRISVSATGEEGNGISRTFSEGTISAGGDRIAYQTDANNIVAGDTNGHGEVLVADTRYVDPEAIDTFLDLWLPRVEDLQFLTDFLAELEIPQEILDEGFHDLAAAQQRLLSTCLAEALELIGPNDDAEAVGELLYHVVFLHEDLSDLDTEAIPNPDLAELVATALPDSLLPSDLIAAINDFGLDQVLPIETVGSQVATLVDSVVGASVEDLPADIEGTLSDLEAVVSDPLDTVTSLVDDIAGQLPLGEVSNLPLDVVNTVGGLIGALDYRVCRTFAAQSEPRDPVCTTSVLGVPTLVDLSGDGVADVSAGLAPNVLGPWSGGATYEASVSRLPEAVGADQGPLEAKVWFEIDDLAGNRTAFGFDGLERGDHLGDGSTLLANVRTGGDDGSLDLRFQLNHSGGSVDRWALFASYRPAGGDFTVGSAQLQPRTAVNGRITLGSAGRWTVNAAPAAPTVADVEFRAERDSGGSRQRFDAHLLVDDISDELAVLVNSSVEDVVQFWVSSGTASLGRAEVAASVVPDIDTPQDRVEIDALLAGFAGLVAFIVDQRTNLAVAKGGVPVDDAAVTIERFESDAVVQAFAGRAADIPETMNVTVDSEASTDVAYSASSQMGRLDVAYLGDVPGGQAGDRLDLVGEFTSIPPEFSANVSQGSVTFDAPASPLGSAAVQLARNGAQVPVVAGDHVTLRAGEPTTQGWPSLAASMKLGGIQSLTADTGDPSTVEVTTSPGGQPFEAHADVFDSEIADRHLLSAVVNALPAHASIVFDPAVGHAGYDGDAVGAVTGFYQRVNAGPTISVDLANVPERVNADWAVTQERVELTLDTIRADGSPAPTTGDLRANVLFSPNGSGGDTPQSGSYVQVGAAGFPSRAGVVFDRAARYGRWQASGPTGEVSVNVRDLIGNGWALSGALEQVPADWDVSWGLNHGRFRALNAGTIGAAELAVTNHGTVDIAGEGVPFVTGRFDETTCAFDAAVRVTGVSHLEFWGGPEQPGATPGDHGGVGRCFDGLAANGSAPVFDAADVPDPGDNTVPAPSCEIDVSGYGVSPPETTACARLDIDLAGADLAVDVRWDGAADEHGSPGEFRRHLSGTVSDLPGTISVVQADDVYAYAGSGNAGLRLQFDMGWTAALDTLSTDDGWEYGIHASDAACDAQTCRISTPTGSESPLCIDEDEATETERADRCLGLRIRAWLDGLPSAVLVDLTDYEFRAEVYDLFDTATRDSIVATATLDHLWDEPVALRLRQLGVPSGADLRFGPITWLRCDNARDPQTDIEFAAAARCSELESDDPDLYTQPDGEVLSTDGYRMAVQAQHSAPLGSLTVQGTVGEAASLDRELSASVRIPSVPADLDIEVNFGQRTMIRSATEVDGIHLFARCMDDSQPDWSPTPPGAPDATAAVSLTDVPSNSVLVAEALPEVSDGNPDPGLQAETLYRFPHCSEIFPETDHADYPDQDPASTAHLDPQFQGGCLIEKTIPLDDLPQGNESDDGEETYLLRYAGDADTLSGWLTTAGPFGLDRIDPRQPETRGPNLRVDIDRVSMSFTALRSRSTVTLFDDKSLLLTRTGGGQVAGAFEVGADVRVRTQACELAIELNGGVKRVQITGTFGLDIGFGDAPPQAEPAGLELRLVNPGHNLKLTTSEFFAGFGLGRGEEPGGGDYDRFELKLQQPAFRYGIDLNARVEFGFIANVRSFDFVLSEEHTSMYLPKLGTDGDTEKIVDHYVPPNVSIDLHGDPTIIERTETANELVIEPDPAYNSQGFLFLPADGALNPNGEHVENWIINTLGSTLLNPNPGGEFRVEVHFAVIFA